MAKRIPKKLCYYKEITKTQLCSRTNVKIFREVVEDDLRSLQRCNANEDAITARCSAQKAIQQNDERRLGMYVDEGQHLTSFSGWKYQESLKIDDS